MSCPRACGASKVTGLLSCLRFGLGYMQKALVVGHAVSTVKHPSLHGWKLLIAQPLTADEKTDGEPILVIDSVGAGVGDRIIISSDGAGTRQLIGHKNTPARWLNLGICDICASLK